MSVGVSQEQIEEVVGNVMLQQLHQKERQLSERLAGGLSLAGKRPCMHLL